MEKGTDSGRPGGGTPPIAKVGKLADELIDKGETHTPLAAKATLLVGLVKGYLDRKADSTGGTPPITGR